MGPALFREDARRTGSVVGSSCSIAKPGLRWCVSTEGAIRSSPLLIGDRVYFASKDGRVYAVDQASGDTVWTTSLGFPALGSPVQTDELLVITGERGIAALYQTDGTVSWRISTDCPVSSTPAIVNDRVIVGFWDGRIVCLETTSGRIEWQVDTDGSVWSSPAIRDQTVYVGSNDGSLYALDATTGRQCWTFTTGQTFPRWQLQVNAIYSSPLFVGDLVYVGSADHRVYALDATTGAQVWTFETNGWIESSPALCDGSIVVGSNDRHVYALDTETGTLQWKRELDSGIFTTPAVASPSIYVGTLSGCFYNLDATTGSIRWLVPIGATIKTSAAVGRDIVCIGDWNGYCRAFADCTTEDLSPVGGEPEDPERLPPTHATAVSKYPTRETLQSGSFQTLYRAQDADSGTPATLLTPALPDYECLDDTALDSLFASLSVWQRLDHLPGVPAIRERGRDPYPWVALEPELGIDFSSVRECALNVRIDSLRRLGEVLTAAHQLGVTHGHVRPTAIRFDTNYENPHILGWGIDRSTYEIEPQQFTHPYLPPEQCSQPLATRPSVEVDLYQYGKLLFDVLFGGSSESRFLCSSEYLELWNALRVATRDDPESRDLSISTLTTLLAEVR